MLLRENGPDGLSVATLMKRQGLTHGGFYAHFESKDDLIEQAIDVMFDKTCERFAVRTRGLIPHQGLMAYIEHYLSLPHVNKPGQGCPVPACAGDVARLGASARRRFEAGMGRLQSLIAAQFEMIARPGAAIDRLALGDDGFHAEVIEFESVVGHAHVRPPSG